jgi:hypothetical protein
VYDGVVIWVLGTQAVHYQSCWTRLGKPCHDCTYIDLLGARHPAIIASKAPPMQLHPCKMGVGEGILV